MIYLVSLVLLLAALVRCSPSFPQTPPRAEKLVWNLSRMEESGRRLYVSVCAFCHGIEGDGFGINAPNLPLPPRDFTDAKYMSGLTDEQIAAVIKFGGTAGGKTAFMPPWGDRFNEREIAALVAYIRALARTGSQQQ